MASSSPPTNRPSPDLRLSYFTGLFVPLVVTGLLLVAAMVLVALPPAPVSAVAFSSSSAGAPSAPPPWA